MTSERRFYTYAYLREDGTPYYIGKGQGNRAYKKGKRDVKPPRDKSRVIFLKRNLTEKEAFKHEVYMISVLGRKDLGTGILRNLTNGGDGSSGAVRSEESKRKMRESKRGERNPMSGRKHSEETLQKLSDINSGENHPLYGKEVSRETRIKMSESHRGRKFSLEHRQKIGEANRGRKLPQAARDKIGAVHRGKKESEETRRKKSESKSKKVELTLISDGTVFVFNSLKDAGQELNLSAGNLSLVCNGKQKSVKGYTARFLT